VCGISGLIWRDRSRPAGLNEVAVMNAALYHRGPDDGGVYGHGQIALGHRRLSIIDLSSSGHQPMLSDDGNLAIVFNGEIYNFIELREELKAQGIRFVSSSDTEVLLRAYERWGADCVRRLNGMWAFVIFDKRLNRLFASRDRFGIKPFHYTFNEQRFAFASEAKALLAAFPDLRRPNEAMLHHFLPSGAVDDGAETFFEGVVQLLPAHNLYLDLQTGSLKTEKYWSVDPEAFAQRWVGSNPVEDLRALLHSSIDLHMRADVPVGTCLSGGIDSSALVGMMAQKHPEQIRTYSGLYKGKEYDEEAFVQAVRRYTNCRGTDIRKQPNGDLFDDLATITWHQDMPTAGPGLYTQFNVMESASRDVKVILDGQGADELFGGYLPYYAARVSDLLQSGSTRDRLSAHALMAQVGFHHGTNWLASVSGSAPLAAARAVARKLGSVRQRLRPSSSDRTEPPFFHESFSNRTQADRITRTLEAPYGDSLSNILCNHLLTQSIPALLHYEDRNSMAFSIEARVPFLDYRIVEFALGLKPEYKVRNSWTKWVLRKAAEPYLPQEVAWRRSKMGYPTPAARWIKEGRNKEAAHELLFSKSFLDRELVSRESVQFYWDQHQAGAADRSWLLYRYATLELWYRHYIDRFEPRTARPAPVEITQVLKAAA
jgi:asparagine synthase (glutamine-hydrolysing)